MVSVYDNNGFNEDFKTAGAYAQLRFREKQKQSMCHHSPNYIRSSSFSHPSKNLMCLKEKLSLFYFAVILGVSVWHCGAYIAVLTGLRDYFRLHLMKLTTELL